MRGTIDVEILPLKETSEHVFIRAKVRGHPLGRKRNRKLFLEIPAHLRDWLPIRDRADDLHDALARAMVFPGMEAKLPVVIHGRVSQSLLENLVKYQEVISRAMPQYQPVEIRADEIVSAPSSPVARVNHTEAILGFSGGMDSIYSLYIHQTGQGTGDGLRIPDCVFVHGFDIPLQDRAYQKAFASARQITDALGSRLFPLRTNLKKLLPFWPHSHGAALGTVLSLFERRHTAGLIAASYAEDNPFSLSSGVGSTPQTDPLLSSNTFQIIHDTGVSRVQKSTILQSFEAGRKNLRVCWSGDDLSSNCGLCSKCVSQMAALKAAGVDDLSAFKHPLTLENILRIDLSTPAFLYSWRSAIAFAEKHGRGAHEIFQAMRQRADECEQMLAAGQIPGAVPARPPGWFARLTRRLRGCTPEQNQ